MTSLRHTLTTEERTLDAARDAIIALGWGRTTLTEVARRAGVSRMTVYRRWGDMSALLADVLTRELTGLFASVDTTGCSMPVGFASTVTEILRASRRNDLLRRVQETDPQSLLPYFKDRPGRFGQMVIDLMSDWLTEGQRAGTIRQGDAALMARAIWLGGLGFHTSLQTVGTADQLLTEHEDMVRRYLEP